MARTRSRPTLDEFGVLRQDDEIVFLSPREQAIAELLLVNFGEVVRDEQMTANLFGGGEPRRDTLRIHASRLRKRVAPIGLSVSCIRNVGYMLHHTERATAQPRDTRKVELLSLAQGSPRRTVEAGEVLIADGETVGALYVLLEGALRIEKDGMQVSAVTEPGACVGEMSLLLGISATADVVAAERSELAVINDARTMLEGDEGLALALARLLAERLHVMTSYLADINQQYRDQESGLGMVQGVLARLMQHPGARSALGSERDPDPEY
jgi:CRP/FNR family cyclic AMP-dependent transcriptional regulator